MNKENLDALLEYATDAEKVALYAAISAPSLNDAAVALDISYNALKKRIQQVRRRAASRGYSPEHEWRKPVPDGHRIRGNSTLFDQELKVERQWVKSERDSDETSKHAEVPPGHFVSKVSTLLDGQGKVRAQWIQAPKNDEEKFKLFWEAAEKNLVRYKGVFDPIPEPEFSLEQLLTLYPLGDPHVGMMASKRASGEDFNLEIVERDLNNTVKYLVQNSASSKRAILANVGDLFHFENESQTTPRGKNKLDCHWNLSDVIDVGFRIMRNLTDMLLTKHKFVQVINLPGNHDPLLSLMLNKWMQAVYENEPRVEIINNENPIQYIRYENVLFGFTHGHTAKWNDLESIMTADRGLDWGETTDRHWITGHVHHTEIEEFRGCTAESFRTLAPKDRWHNAEGYRSKQSLTAITYSAMFGEIARINAGLALIRSLDK